MTMPTMRRFRMGRGWQRVAVTRIRRWSMLLAGALIAAVVVPAVGFLVSDTPDEIVSVTAQVLLLGSALVALLLSSGGYAADRRSGMAILWLQKPVSPTLFYLGRFVPRLGLAVGTALAAAALLAVVRLLVGDGVERAELVAGALTMALLFGILASIVHAVSSFGLPREELFGVAAFLAGCWIAASIAGEPWEPTLRHILAVPLDPAEFSGRFLAGLPVDDGGLHLLRTLAYATGWVVLGTLASGFTTRSPLRREDD